MKRRALITGITGQDGSYLAELLLSKGYDVFGIIRRSSSFNTERIDHIFANPGLALIHGDLCDASSINRIVRDVEPNEVYNLGAQSHVRVSFDEPEYTIDSIAMGTLRLLEAVRSISPEARFYQASSSEMFGNTPGATQSESTPFRPRSPYGCAKLCAHHLAINYREGYGMCVSCGILFNHESPRRGGTFVTRKITRAVARIKAGLQDALYLGNLDAKRDWGYARDYVNAMWLMLQRDKPSDYVIATGETHSVREFLDEAFSYVGIDYRKHVVGDTKYFRPSEVDHLCGDASKARRALGWTPEVTFKQLVRLMVDADMGEVKQ